MREGDGPSLACGLLWASLGGILTGWVPEVSKKKDPWRASGSPIAKRK